MSNVFIKLTNSTDGSPLFIDRRVIALFSGPGAGPTYVSVDPSDPTNSLLVKETPNRVLKLINESEDAFDASL